MAWPGKAHCFFYLPPEAAVLHSGRPFFSYISRPLEFSFLIPPLGWQGGMEASVTGGQVQRSLFLMRLIGFLICWARYSDHWLRPPPEGPGTDGKEKAGKDGRGDSSRAERKQLPAPRHAVTAQRPPTSPHRRTGEWAARTCFEAGGPQHAGRHLRRCPPAPVQWAPTAQHRSCSRRAGTAAGLAELSSLRDSRAAPAANGAEAIQPTDETGAPVQDAGGALFAAATERSVTTLRLLRKPVSSGPREEASSLSGHGVGRRVGDGRGRPDDGHPRMGRRPCWRAVGFAPNAQGPKRPRTRFALLGFRTRDVQCSCRWRNMPRIGTGIEAVAGTLRQRPGLAPAARAVSWTRRKRPSSILGRGRFASGRPDDLRSMDEAVFPCARAGRSEDLPGLLRG